MTDTRASSTSAGPRWATRVLAVSGYAIAFLTGLGMVVAFSWLGYQSFRVGRDFVPTDATIVRAWVESREASGRGGGGPRWEVRAEYEYTVDERSYSSETAHTGELTDEREALAAAEAAPGTRLQCWYDPLRPEESTTHVGSPWIALWALAGLAFMIVAGVRGARAWRDPDGQPLPEA